MMHQNGPLRPFVPLTEQLQRKRYISPALLPLFAITLLLFTRLFKDVLLRGDGIYLSVIVLQILIFLLPSVVWIRVSGDGYLSRLRLKPGRPETILFTVAASVLLTSGGLLLSMLFSGTRDMTGTFSLYEALGIGDGGTLSINPMYLILAYAALPAISEEILFRGILSAEYERHGVSVSVLASTVLFVCIHFRFDGIPVYLFSGFILAVTTYLSGSVWAAVIAHFVYNLFGLFGQPYLHSLYEITGSLALFLFVPIVLFLLSLAIFCGEAERLCKLYAERNLPNIEVPRSKSGAVVPFRIRLRAVFFRTDAILCVILWIIASVLFLFLK